MDFLQQDQIEKIGLTKEQLDALKPLAETHIADLKKQWDGKANSDAEGILNGALAKTIEVTKITRLQGEKAADYVARAAQEYLATKQSEVDAAKTAYEQKLKDFKGDEATKEELNAAKAKLDDAQKKLADYDTLKAKADKYEPLESEYKTMKMQLAFNSVKPVFPEGVNPYEAKAKWEEFVNGVQSKYTIEYVDGEAKAIDKENQYKVVTLKSLLEADTNLTELAKGRQQQGSGAKPAGQARKIDGVPFDVPQNITSPEAQKLIKEHLTSKEGLRETSPEYAKRFKELWTKIPR